MDVNSSPWATTGAKGYMIQPRPSDCHGYRQNQRKHQLSRSFTQFGPPPPEDMGHSNPISVVMHDLMNRARLTMMRDIVNKTNIAESKAGVQVIGVELEEDNVAAINERVIAAGDDETGEDSSISQIVALVRGEDLSFTLPGSTTKHDPVHAILASAGVEYNPLLPSKLTAQGYNPIVKLAMDERLEQRKRKQVTFSICWRPLSHSQSSVPAKAGESTE